MTIVPSDTSTANLEIIRTRVFDAPRHLVFEAWTDPKHMAQWWGPNGFTNTIYEMDVRPGGVCRVTMHGPDGVDYPNEMVYSEVVKPERLVYTHGSGEKDDPGKFDVTVTFDEQSGKTMLTMRALFPSVEEFERVKAFGAIEGGNQTLNRLEQYLTKMPVGKEFVITRVFDAPRNLVWQAWTEAQHLEKWWGPKGFALLVAKLEVRPGGVFHYRMRSQGGQEMWGRFVYQEIVTPEKIVYVLSFADENGNIIRAPFSESWPLEVLNTVTFVEHDGKTILTLRGGPICASDEERAKFEEMFDSMQQGFTGTFDQLEEYLETS